VALSHNLAFTNSYLIMKNTWLLVIAGIFLVNVNLQAQDTQKITALEARLKAAIP